MPVGHDAHELIALALNRDHKGTTADFTVCGESLRARRGVENQRVLLTAERAQQGLAVLHGVNEPHLEREGKEDFRTVLTCPF